jgi:hypothetical protein
VAVGDAFGLAAIAILHAPTVCPMPLRTTSGAGGVPSPLTKGGS